MGVFMWGVVVFGLLVAQYLQEIERAVFALSVVRASTDGMRAQEVRAELLYAGFRCSFGAIYPTMHLLEMRGHVVTAEALYGVVVKRSERYRYYVVRKL